MKINEITSDFVNKQVDRTQWSKMGTGQTASVWQNMADPDTVVKLVGGGFGSIVTSNERRVSIAFVHFCNDYGPKTPHLPRILEINTDDPEVVQIRLERLFPLPNAAIGSVLRDLVTNLAYNRVNDLELKKIELDKRLINADIEAKNSVDSIITVSKLILNNAQKYGEEQGIEDKVKVDPHGGNWMLRKDGTLVAVDPWYCE